jgi:hypothetical protein
VNKPGLFLSSMMHSEGQERIIVLTPFNPVKEVYPDYPELLKKEGVSVQNDTLLRNREERSSFSEPIRNPR